MELTKNVVTLDLLKENLKILDSMISEFRFYFKDNTTFLEISFIDEKERLLQIVFSELIEFSYLYNFEYNTYVEDYKFEFIENENVFYLSLDPSSDSREISNNDNDIIISKQMIIIVDNQNFELLRF